MHTKKVSNLVLIMLLLLASVSVLVIKTSADSANNDEIKTYFIFEFDTPTCLNLSVSINVTKITTSYGEHDRSDIEKFWENITIPHDERGAIRQKLWDGLEKQLDTLFFDPGQVKIEVVKNLSYNITIREFTANFILNLTPSFFGIENVSDIDKLMTGLLDKNMEIIVKYSFNFNAEISWNNYFIFDLTSSPYTTTEQTSRIDGMKFSNVEFQKNNLKGEKTISEKINIFLKNNDIVDYKEKENIFLNYQLNSSNVDNNFLKILMNFKTVNIMNYDIPDFIAYKRIIPADGIRLLVDYNIISWEDFKQNTIIPIKERIIEYIENSTFNQKLNLSFEWDKSTTSECPRLEKYDIYNMNIGPAIKATYSDKKINITIFNISSKAFFGLINAGAQADINKEDINFGENLEEIHPEFNITFCLPKNMTLNDENPYEANKDKPIEGEVASEKQNIFNEEKKETIIEIDLQNPSLNVLSFVTGKTELEFDAIIKEYRSYYVLDIKNQSEYFPIPEKIILDYLCADAFRLSVQENVFSDENMNSFLSNEKNIFTQRTAGLWPGLNIVKKANIDRNSFDSSIYSEEINIFEMDEYPAIKVNNYAEIVKPIKFDLGIIPPSFKIEEQEFNIKGIEGHNVTYRIIFPKGIDIEVKTILDKDMIIRETSDGRKILEISYNSSEQNLSSIIYCNLEASGFFVLGIFLPCILTFIVAIILVILIILMRRKKGKGSIKNFFKRKSKKDDFEEGSFEDEEYYVPPPPDSKK